MASFTCLVVCVTKRLRLERLVRPPHAELAPDPAIAQPLSRTVQQVLAGSLGRRLPRAEPSRAARAAKNLHRAPAEADSAGRTLRSVARVRSRGAPGPTADAFTACARCKRRRCAGCSRSHEAWLQQCGKQGLTPK